MIVLSCDPGINGAVAAYSTTAGVLEWANLPTTEIVTSKASRIRRKADAAGLRTLIRHWSVRHKFAAEDVVVVVERMLAMAGGASPVTLVSMGHTSGVVEGVLSAWSSTILQPTPMQWKRAMGVTSDKATSQAELRRRFPLLPKMRHDAAEAILLAVWGSGEVQGQTMVADAEDDPFALAAA